MILYFVITILAVANADFNISGNFSFCHQTDQIIDFDLENDQLFNLLNILRLHEDEFNLIGNSIVVYSHNGQIFSTSCISIFQIFVPLFFNTCCIDLPVYYFQDNVKIILFFTKSGILRNSSTIIECQEEPTFFSFNKTIITVMYRTAKIEKKKTINILKLTNFIFKNDINLTSSFFDYYFQNFAKNKVFITIRDMIEYIFMLIVAVFFKNKYVNFIEFVSKTTRKYIANSKKNNKQNKLIHENKISTNNETTIIKLVNSLSSRL